MNLQIPVALTAVCMTALWVAPDPANAQDLYTRTDVRESLRKSNGTGTNSNRIQESYKE